MKIYLFEFLKTFCIVFCVQIAGVLLAEFNWQLGFGNELCLRASRHYIYRQGISLGINKFPIRNSKPARNPHTASLYTNSLPKSSEFIRYIHTIYIYTHVYQIGVWCKSRRFSGGLCGLSPIPPSRYSQLIPKLSEMTGSHYARSAPSSMSLDRRARSHNNRKTSTTATTTTTSIYAIHNNPFTQAHINQLIQSRAPPDTTSASSHRAAREDARCHHQTTII